MSASSPARRRRPLNRIDTRAPLRSARRRHHILTEALAAVIRGEVSDSVLDTYSDDRLTAFWTVSSPMSTESKRLVFHSGDPDRLEIDLQMLRRIALKPSLLAGFWSGGSRIESPSVVTGQFLSRGRNIIKAS